LRQQRLSEELIVLTPREKTSVTEIYSSSSIWT